jgi:hypothetical protein
MLVLYLEAVGIKLLAIFGAEPLAKRWNALGLEKLAETALRLSLTGNQVRFSECLCASLATKHFSVHFQTLVCSLYFEALPTGDLFGLGDRLFALLLMRWPARLGSWLFQQGVLYIHVAMVDKEVKLDSILSWSQIMICLHRHDARVQVVFIDEPPRLLEPVYVNLTALWNVRVRASNADCHSSLLSNLLYPLNYLEFEAERQIHWVQMVISQLKHSVKVFNTVC